MQSVRVSFFLVLLFGAFRPNAIAVPVPESGEQSNVISGTVVDATGGTVGGAVVVLKTAGAAERKTVSDATGRFVFHNVATGPASLTVTLERFAPVTRALTGARTEVRIVLQPVPIVESVIVHAPTLAADRITTATRTDTPLRDVPQAISVVTRDLIADQTMRSMADVVRYMPGVGMAQGEGHRDAPILRGNTSTADFFVDGVRDDTQYLRDLYNVERVEALKGPNGMIFGRGGVGGIINRVTRQADWTPSREITVQGGSWDHRRLTVDLGQALNPHMAVRVTGVYEDSDSYRTAVGIERYGLNPTLAFAIGPNTTVRTGYEFFHDNRTTDRGVPSFRGLPLETDPSTFFGSTDLNSAEITVNALSSTLEHRFGDGFMLRNRVSYADYDKFYRNLVPGAVNSARTMVSLTGYDSGTQRQNFFNQTDLIASRRMGRFEHTFLAGVELGRQVTDNLRRTAYFTSVTPTTTSVMVPLTDPVTSQPVEFRLSATDADNHGTATVAAVYAQDQIGLSRHIDAIVGLRYDSFSLDLMNNRNQSELASDDGLLSPRFALVFKPVVPVSLYASYTVSYLPRAGEQLASLSLSNRALDPEDFRNYEVGAKWDLASRLSFSAAVYRLDHGNVIVPDPNTPELSHLVDAERMRGLEAEVSGNVSNRWSLIGGYAYQNGEIIRSLSSSVQAGARLGQVPRHSFSLWNKYELSPMWGLGLGVISRGDSFVSTDNTVVLPGFTRVDAAVFFTLARVRAHLNLENLFDERYYASAHNNNNITPGSPRAVRVALTTRF